MYFLKCDFCGYDNPLKTEYLTFCENCGKKLNDAFSDWKKHHPSGTFEEYKSSTGQKEKVPHVRKHRYGISFKAMVTGLLLFASAGMLYLITSTGNLTDLFLPQTLKKETLQEKWQRYNYGKYGLTVSTPVRLEEDKLKIPVAYHDRVQDMESYSWHPAKGFRVFIINVLYREGIPVSLQHVAAGTINELINKPGVTNVEYRQSPLMYEDVVGIRLEGNFHQNEVFLRFQSVLYVRRSNVWTVTVIYNDNDATGKEVAEKVMESIEINYFGAVI